ncbi:MAG: glycoside hydrolase family 3 N-terminal domain-containing protein [Sedimentibacter sp.]|uniref:glycoside hydrolase family 3 N-terminal domain-containing protein n=1 Tax=Sedimentibacter sp. TaxID=1960295 RepID=UPI003158A9EB
MKKIFVLLTAVLLLSGCAFIIDMDEENPDSDTGYNPPVNESPEPEPSTKPQNTSLFHEYTQEAMKYLEKMTLEEKIGQMFLVRCPDEVNLDLYLSLKPGGFILFGRDFAKKTREQVISDIEYYQTKSTIPMIMGVDEEGGTVVRVSSNPLLSDERFKSPQELFELGGLDEIRKDAAEKSKLLLSLGINLNLAPVADVSTDEADFIYERSFGKNAEETAQYVGTVVEAMKENNMSSTLKHFPGYGNNLDTHTGSAYDTRPYEQFENSDFLPFMAGIRSGVQSVLVSHNVVESIDNDLPASLSKKAIDILRNNLEFTGIIMTDDLSMGAVADLKLEHSVEASAVLAGNDMLIVTDYEKSFNALMDAVEKDEISVDRIDESVLRILKWKLYMKIM